MTTTNKTLQILKKARSLIAKKDNWWQGNYTDGNNRFCAVGAVRAARCRIKPMPMDYYESHARELLESQIPLNRSLITYNDAPRRKHSDVIAVFDRAIKMLDKRYTK